MALVVSNMKKDDRWKVLKDEISQAEESESMFSIFSSCEIEFNSMVDIFAYCFEYMPSSIEVEEPHEFNTSSNTVTSWLNDFAGRLHQTDMIAKRVRADNEMLQRNTSQLFRNFLTYAIKNGKKTDDELSKVFGIPLQDVPRFTEPFINEGWVEKKEGEYHLK